MNDDDELLERLDDALNAPVPAPSPDRIAAVREAAERVRMDRGAESATSTSTSVGGLSGRRAWLLGAAAAAVGAVAGGAVVAMTDQEDASTTAPGPPTEPLQFSPAAEAGTTVTGQVINHTWGVELLLDATGFAVGSRYRVVYLDTEAASTEAGGFLGSTRPTHCRCNAALLRDDIAAIEIRNADDVVISRADFV